MLFESYLCLLGKGGMKLPRWFKQVTFWTDVLLVVVVGGVGILGLYNLATFSFGGD